MAFTLTGKQAAVKAFIVDYIARNEMAPSYDEIGDGLGLASKSGVHRIVKALVERGHLQVIPGKARAMRVIS